MTNGGDSKKLRIPRIGSLPQATVMANSYRDPYPCVFCSSYRIFSLWLPFGCPSFILLVLTRQFINPSAQRAATDFPNHSLQFAFVHPDAAAIPASI